jgi:GT2 family glycosyltransferase
MHRICIILLNWNGWRDTLVCLESLRRQTGVEFLTVVADNGSADRSLDEIRQWAALATPPIAVERVTRSEAADPAVAAAAREWYAPQMHHLLLLENGENLGFAAGNNVAMALALASGADFVWLLNNDAKTEPATARRLADYLDAHPHVGAVTPAILHMGTSRVANCGGTVNWLGFRRYKQVGVDRHALPADAIPVNYVTGCALMAPARVLWVHGLLTERFFFGEEDHDFSHRLDQAGLKLACVTSAAVEHKFGATIKVSSKADLSRAYIFYINRYVGNRDRLAWPIWQLHRWLNLLYALPMIRVRYGASLHDMRRFTAILLRDSSRLDGISRDYFQRLMREGIDGLA